MKLPFVTRVWTHQLFALVVALGLLVLAAFVLWSAAVYARFDLDPLMRQPHENAKAIVLLIVSMLLVVAALVVPLVIRRKAQRRLGERP